MSSMYCTYLLCSYVSLVYLAWLVCLSDTNSYQQYIRYYPLSTMNYLTLQYNYTQLMKQAEQASSRQEALHCIQCATALREAMDAVNRFNNKNKQ